MSKQLLLLSLLCLGLSSMVIASELQVGEAFPATRLQNQHGETVEIPTRAKIIVFAVEMEASDLANAYFEQQPSDFLERHQAHFLVDISGMPSMITRMFALPKMRKRPYAILLVEEQETLTFVPRRENGLTVLRLDQGRVESVGYVASETALDEVFATSRSD